MTRHTENRREFLQKTGTAAAGLMVPYWLSSSQARAQESKNDRHVIGCIGTGDRWKQIVGGAMNHGDVVAVCDVDRKHLEEGYAKVGGKAEMHEDYRKVLDRKDIDVVTIVTPDHWHSKIAIEAMQAGKDVYCEKPLTLTIEEGKQIRKVLKDTGRVFQVGTQQRSEMNQVFLTAVALIRDGRIGDVKEVQCAIGGSLNSGPIPKVDPPPELNWEMWLGQAPKVDFRFSPPKDANDKWGHSRCHYQFRWWYEYSGGKMTDWGAHHVDIAQWAIGMDQTGPLTVEGTATHPVPFKDGYPLDDTQYNAATKFLVTCMFPGDIKMTIRHDTDNGILFTGTKGRFFVNRGKIAGEPVDALKDKPLPEDALTKVYKGKQPGNHMRNFFECVKSREQPISDVDTHHRAMTTCHLANIAIRLGRKITWDAEKEEIVGDEEARSFQAREQRKGYEIKV